MKYLNFILLLICCQSLQAATVTLTAFNSVNGADGSLEISIDPEFAYPPFNITVDGPNNYSWSVNGDNNYNHMLAGLQAGEYFVVITNNIDCTVTGMVEILRCYSSGGGVIPTIVLCQQKGTTDGGGVFYLASPSNIHHGVTVSDLEFRLISERTVSASIEEISLTKGIQSVYDIQLIGSTIYDIPAQEDILDESLNLIIKFNAVGDILWVYHKEAEFLGATDRSKDYVEKDAQEVSAAYSLECQTMPNPFTNTFEVQLFATIAGKVELQLFDINGKLVEENTVYCEAGELTRQTLHPIITPGIYILKALDATGNSIAVKVIKI